jgi:hypothetical protein
MTLLDQKIRALISLKGSAKGRLLNVGNAFIVL